MSEIDELDWSTDIYGRNALIERFCRACLSEFSHFLPPILLPQIAAHLDRSGTDRGRKCLKRLFESHELIGKRQEWTRGLLRWFRCKCIGIVTSVPKTYLWLFQGLRTIERNQGYNELLFGSHLPIGWLHQLDSPSDQTEATDKA